MGAQAGIGAGAGVLVIALGVVGFLMWKLRRNKKALLVEKGQDNSGVLPAYYHQQPYAGHISQFPPIHTEPYHYQTGLGVGGPGQGLGGDTASPGHELDPYAHHSHAFGGRMELPATSR
jgi:hypothetical protein